MSDRTRFEEEYDAWSLLHYGRGDHKDRTVDQILDMIADAPYGAIRTGFADALASTAAKLYRARKKIDDQEETIRILSHRLAEAETKEARDRYRAMTAGNVIAQVAAAAHEARGTGKQVKAHILSELDRITKEYGGGDE